MQIKLSNLYFELKEECRTVLDSLLLKWDSFFLLKDLDWKYSHLWQMSPLKSYERKQKYNSRRCPTMQKCEWGLDFSFFGYLSWRELRELVSDLQNRVWEWTRCGNSGQMLKFSHFGAYGQNKYHGRLGWSRMKSPEQVGTFCQRFGTDLI